jgi:DNA-binding FadR family transcriptional regulator
MRVAIERMRVEAARQTADFAEADLNLHIAVANAAGNPFMRSIGAVIGAALRASFQLSEPRDSGDYRSTVAAHERIVDAIAERDAAAAATAMTNVILIGLRRHEPAN